MVRPCARASMTRWRVLDHTSSMLFNDGPGHDIMAVEKLRHAWSPRAEPIGRCGASARGPRNGWRYDREAARRCEPLAVRHDRWTAAVRSSLGEMVFKGGKTVDRGCRLCAVMVI
jgi:hypothetical protein